MHLRALSPMTALSACLALWLLPATRAAAADPPIPGGQLQVIADDGVPQLTCPLEHTDVDAQISGFIGRVTVKQKFVNPYDNKIEAIYVFPLPQNAAVDSMVMLVGDRRVVGAVKERGEARAIFEQARAAGHVAGLLDQERPNIFTQSVANIEPGATVEIEISYVETLAYDDGVFEWVFPMVVGPRYIPGGGSAPAPMTNGQDTPQVPDGSRISPPVVPEGMRSGHDISLHVTVAAGVPVTTVESPSHRINIATRRSEPWGVQMITLADEDTIPNKDFVLHYRPSNRDIGNAFLTHTDERGSFFTLLLQPPERVVPEQLMPRELIFVLDTSGSMSGIPIEKAKEVMARMIDTMRDGDTFNLITFAGDTRILWAAPRPNTKENRAIAQEFLLGQHGGGGTEMMKAIKAALVQTAPQPSDGPAPIRIVCFMTDGYVGNDMAIIDAVAQNADTTRVFSFGIGNSVNRFLLDGMARAGRGDVEYVMLESQGEAAVERFHERVLAPVLTDIEIDWGDAPVADVFPKRVPDLFSAKPIMVHGWLTGPVSGVITLRGQTGAGPYAQSINLSNVAMVGNDGLASLWARAKVKDLMSQDYTAAQQGNFPEELKKQVTALGVEFGLMTQFTSFVAVEEMTVTSGGEPVTVQVPVEMPDGVSYSGIFGDKLSALPAGQVQLLTAGAGRFGGGMAGGGISANNPNAAPAIKQRRAPVNVAHEEPASPSDEKDAAGTDPSLKLDESLRDLAKRVEHDGKDGDLTAGKIHVVDYRVDVMVRLRDLSDNTRKALAALGFQLKTESRTVSLLIGSIDVRKLSELVALETVVSVKPLR